LQGGSNGSRGLSPPSPLTLTTADPLAGGEGAAAPPQEPHPRSRPSVLPPMKNPKQALDCETVVEVAMFRNFKFLATGLCTLSLQ